MEAEGRPAAPGEDNEAGLIAAGPGWFETIGLGLLEGRYLTDRDTPDSPAVVVNARLARHFFGTASPIGRRIRFNLGGDRPQLHEIVGVVRDARHYGLKARDWPMVFLPSNRDGGFVLRTQGEVSGIGNTIRAAVARSGGIAQVERIRSYRDEIVDVAIFAGAALLLAVVAALAGWVPAHRASRIDAMEALRHE